MVGLIGRGQSTIADIPNNTASDWYRDPALRKNVLHIVILYMAVYSLGYDGSLLNGLQALPAWVRDFDDPRGTTLGLISAAYYLPKIPTGFFVAYISDRFGRKTGLYIGAILMIAGALLGGFAQNLGQLIGSRIIIGVGTATGQITALVMIPELAHPRLRHWCGSFFMCTFFFGAIFAAWLTFGMVYFPGNSSWSWRIPSLIQGVGPAILLFAWVIPESPRWLHKRGRVGEAHQILAKYHANGQMDDALVLFEMREIDEAIRRDQMQNASSWLAFLTDRNGRKRLFVILIITFGHQLSGNTVISYFLVQVLRQVGITAPAQTAGVNGGLQVWSFICALTGASLVERLGRRFLILLSFYGCFVAFSFITGLSGGFAITRQQSVGVAMVPFIFLFNAMYAVGFTPIPYMYVAEITPLALRPKACALYITGVNCLIAFNSFVNPIALAAIGWYYYFVFLGCLVFFGIVSWFVMRETRGLTTEEAARVYDDEVTENQMARVEGDETDAKFEDVKVEHQVKPTLVA